MSAGALVIALGFMVEPFLQAIISDYGVLVDLDASKHNYTKATIGKSNRFDGGTQCVSTYPSDYPKIDTTPDFAVAAALYDGLNAANGHGYQNVTLTCTSGNCTWALYTSLAVRSTCYDISSHLKRTTLEDLPDATSATQISSSATASEPVTTSTNVISYSPQPETYEAPSSTFPDPDDSPTSSSDAISSTRTPQTSSEVEAPMYSAPFVTEVTALTGGQVTPIKSAMTQATVGLERRESSNVQLSSTSTQSSATWTDWTLDHLGLTLSNTDGFLRINQSTFAVLQAAVVADPNSTINFKASQALLAAFTIIRTNNTQALGSPEWDAADASAMECGLELTLNVYNSSVRNNVLVEQIVASASDKVPQSWLPLQGINQSLVHPHNLPVDQGTQEWNPVYHDAFLYRDDYELSPTTLNTSTNETFKIAQQSLVSTLNFLTSLIRQDHDNGTVKAVLQQDRPPLHTYGSAILQPLLNQTNTTATFEAIARSMSNAIRNVGNESMSGTTQQWVRYYQVRWAFLALPLSLFTSKSQKLKNIMSLCTDQVLLVGSIFFALSILDAHRLGVPILKADSIATIVHGPDQSLHQNLRDKNHTHSLSDASETMAKLEWFPEGYALIAAKDTVVRISRPTTPVRDEEEHEMSDLNIPTTPQTPGSNITLVEPQSGGGGDDQETIKSISPVHYGPDWSDVPIDDSSAASSVRRSV